MVRTTMYCTIFQIMFHSCAHYVDLFLPDAVVDQLTLDGPVFFDASFLDIFGATFFGLHAGYGLLESLAELRPHSLPVLTSVHSSPNHLPKPPLEKLLR